MVDLTQVGNTAFEVYADDELVSEHRTWHRAAVVAIERSRAGQDVEIRKNKIIRVFTEVDSDDPDVPDEPDEDEEEEEPELPDFPVASFSVDPESPEVNELVHFDAEGSTCNSDSCQYVWTDVKDGGAWELGEGVHLDFAFSSSGEKHVQLSVGDDHGQKDKKVKVINVRPNEEEDEPEIPENDSEEVNTGLLRDGFGGVARPNGDEYMIPVGYPHGQNCGFVESGLSESDLEDVGTLRLDREGMEVSGVRASRVEVLADNCKLSDSIIEGSGLYSVDAFRSGQRGFVMENCDVHQLDHCRKALYARNATFRSVNAWGGDTVAVLRSNVNVDWCFIHDPTRDCSGRHYDAIHSQGAENLHITNTTALIVWRNQTAAIITQSNQSRLDNLHVEDCFLAGGTYTLYIRERNHGRPTNVRVVNNLWQADSWQFGYHRRAPYSHRCHTTV